MTGEILTLNLYILWIINNNSYRRNNFPEGNLENPVGSDFKKILQYIVVIFPIHWILVLPTGI